MPSVSSCLRKRGDRVAAGDVLAEIHARDDASATSAMSEVLGAYELSDEQPRPSAVVRELIA